ncbi:MAG: hypothetical protein LUQ50_14175 [Methanospirillum sp.]|uniref:hypothetical protein n=1 Tax=Methanospirillum sp. TaxID=45200 RepID=UPI00237517FE|nr:hypothetical protein [Methanospirillum sp.]MDD1730203.1 hypothetical protein [Methanospirillum sp.]
MTGITLENQFICDRMAGSLCRHLRLLGCNTRNLIITIHTMMQVCMIRPWVEFIQGRAFR